MNYDMINLVSDGVIVEKIHSGEVIFTNNAVKNLLHISGEIKSLNEILRNDAVNKELHDYTLRELKTEKFAIGKVYFKTSKGNFVEVLYHCGWLVEEEDLVTYTFQHCDNTIDEATLNIHNIKDFTHAGIVFMDLEPELTVTYANSHYYELMHVTESDKINRNMVDKHIAEEEKWVIDEIYKSANKNKNIDIEFPIEIGDDIKFLRFYGKKNHSPIGQKVFYLSEKDYGSKRQVDETKRLERQFFENVLKLEEDTMFRIDLEDNTLYLLGNYSARFEGKTTIPNFPEGLISAGLIYSEDVEIFRGLKEYFKNGVQKSLEVRFIMTDKSVQWHKIAYNFIKNSEGKPIVVTGKLTNIHEQKMLEETASLTIDSLTTFFTKNAFVDKFNNLSNTETTKNHTLFLIDIDNFEYINKTLGNHFGDIVLREIAGDIKNCFKQTDVLGRIGGDEFVVIMKDCVDDGAVDSVAELVCSCLQKVYNSQNTRIAISASVGYVQFDAESSDFDNVYKKAVTALYIAKNNGKNCFEKFVDSADIVDIQGISDIHHMKRREHTLLNNEVIANVFNLLYETNDIDLSLHTVLEYLGTTYKTDRVYIFEATDGNNSEYINKHQWTRGMFMRQEREMTVLDDVIIDDVFSKADDEGIVYTDDITIFDNPDTVQALKDDKVISIVLIDALKKEHDMFLGVDDCRNKRQWTDEEVRTLLQCAKIIFVVLSSYNIITKLNDVVKNK